MAKKISDFLLQKNNQVSQTQVHNFAQNYLQQIKKAQTEMQLQQEQEEKRKAELQSHGKEITQSVISKYLQQEREKKELELEMMLD